MRSYFSSYPKICKKHINKLQIVRLLQRDVQNQQGKNNIFRKNTCTDFIKFNFHSKFTV